MASRPRLILTDRTIRAAAPHPKYNRKIADGEGLWLQITPAGAKSWLLIFTWRGKLREMGLGPYPLVKLAAAREAAQEARLLVREGIDPIEVRRQRKAEQAGMPTFKDFGLAMVDEWAPGWKTAKQKLHWQYTIETHCAAICRAAVDTIDTDAVLKVLRPLWDVKPETAQRTRSRIEKILDAATVAKLRTGENPARWKGHLALMLSKPKTLTRGHQAAMPYEELPAFMQKLAALESTSARALEFTILTASRTDEVLKARKSEFDLRTGLWTIPKERAKGGEREHLEPLVGRAFEIVRLFFRASPDPDAYLFPGGAGDGHLSNMAMSMCLRGIVGDGYTVHGMRSTFSDWVGDETEFTREVREAALSHVVGDRAERAYRRRQALKKRQALMQAWAEYALTPPSQTRAASGAQ